MDTKAIVGVAAIIIYYFIQGFFINAFLDSSLITGSYINTTSPEALDYTVFNETGSGEEIETKSAMSGGIWDTFKVMFGMAAGLPDMEGFPNGVKVFISFHNWILLITLIMLAYRILNPLA
jgi:hypothetical protein